MILKVSLQELAHFWGDLLGLTKTGSYRAEVSYFSHRSLVWTSIKQTLELQKENVDEDIYALGQGVNTVEVDLMEPIDPEKSPKVHIPALNHIGMT